VIKSFSIAFPIRLLGAVSLLLQAIILAKILDPEQVGSYFLCISLVSVLAVFSRLGLDQGLVSRLSDIKLNGEKTCKEEFSNSLVFALLNSLILIAIILSITPLLQRAFSESVGNSIQILIIALPCYTIYNLIAEFFKYTQSPVISILSRNVLSQLLFLITLTVDLMFLESIEFKSICLQFISCSYLGCFLSLAFANLKLSDFSSSLTSYPELFRGTFSLTILSLSSMTIGWLDIILLGLFLPESQIALYTVATRASSIISFISVVILTIIASPLSSNLKLAKYDNSNLIIRKACLLSAFLSLTSLIAYVIFGRVALDILFGPEYALSYPILVILALAHTINTSFGPTGFSMICTGEQRALSLYYFVMSLISILFIVLTASSLQLYAGAAAAIFCTFGVNATCAFHLRFRFGLYRVTRL
jgi:O-antigen/teichoic acid export membrane protein